MTSEVWPEALSIERRAGRIGDSLERLRFLREAMRDRLDRFEDRPAVPHPPPGRRARPWLPAVLLLACATSTADGLRPQSLPDLPRAAAGVPEVWLVERTPDWELYSNGLRVEHRLAVSTRPRLYRLLPHPDSEDRSRSWQTRPAGIVFHASEGELASFRSTPGGYGDRPWTC